MILRQKIGVMKCVIGKDEYGYFLIEHEYATEGMYCIELYDLV